jgi:hypothetical protein
MGVRARRQQIAQELGPRVLALPRVAPESLGELVTVADIVSTGAVSAATVRRAYRTGALVGFIPAGKPPGRSGRAGYRFRKGDVLAWLYNAPSPEVDDETAND